MTKTIKDTNKIVGIIEAETAKGKGFMIIFEKHNVFVPIDKITFKKVTK